MPLNCRRQTILLRLELFAEKMEWENGEHVGNNLRIHPEGFDLILGAGIYIQKYLFFFFFCYSIVCGFLTIAVNHLTPSQRASFQQYGNCPLFDSVEKLLKFEG